MHLVLRVWCLVFGDFFAKPRRTDRRAELILTADD